MGFVDPFKLPLTFISLAAYSQVARGMAGSRRILSLMQTEIIWEKMQTVFRPKWSAQCALKMSHLAVSLMSMLQGSTLMSKRDKQLPSSGQTGSGKAPTARPSTARMMSMPDTSWSTASDKIATGIWPHYAARFPLSRTFFLFSRSHCRQYRVWQPRSHVTSSKGSGTRSTGARVYHAGFRKGTKL